MRARRFLSTYFTSSVGERDMESAVLLAVLLVWATIVVVPVVVYGIFSAVSGLKPPGDSPAMFLAGTAVAKLGTAIAFVAIYYMARDAIGSQWLLYAGIWWLMFVIGELGQVVTRTYSWQEAIAGIISETIYFPLAGLILNWLVRVQGSVADPSGHDWLSPS
jgi:hypothetical protein